MAARTDCRPARVARKAAVATWGFSGMLDAIFIAAGLAFFVVFSGMLDAIFIAAGLAFSVVATLYTYACGRL